MVHFRAIIHFISYVEFHCNLLFAYETLTTLHLAICETVHAPKFDSNLNFVALSPREINRKGDFAARGPRKNSHGETTQTRGNFIQPVDNSIFALNLYLVHRPKSPSTGHNKCTYVWTIRLAWAALRLVFSESTRVVCWRKVVLNSSYRLVAKSHQL